MNQDLTNWVWNYSKATTLTGRLVLLALAFKANVVGEATVTVADLVKLCRCSEMEVKNALRGCIKDEEIQIFQNHDAQGQRTTNTYKFTVAGLGTDNGEDDIQFEDPTLTGIPVPKVRDLPKEPQPRLMMDATALAAIAADPIYQGLDVQKEAWRFKRWCVAHEKDQTVRRFKVWLARV